MKSAALDAEAKASGLRIDKWLWFARFLKTRSAAQRLIEGGRLRLNGRPTRKAHQSVKPGDVLSFPLGPHVRVIKIRVLADRRGSADQARLLYEDLEPPENRGAAGRKEGAGPGGATGPSALRDPGTGRPTKRDRRRIDRLRDDP